MRSCLKQLTRCKVVFPMHGFAVYEATNECDVDDFDVCPRVTAGCATGEGYELCGSTHAEANAAALIPNSMEYGIAYLFGHDWYCRACQHALMAKGVATFVITGEAA